MLIKMPEITSGIFISPPLKANNYTNEINSISNNKCDFTVAKL
jgi:hypothetical protein